MCGFAGIFHSSGHPVDQATLTRMAATMVHRGPDDNGYKTISTNANGTPENLGFAFRRLSIIDVSPAGHQPMVSDDDQIVLVFNGEIYNAPILRQELEKNGSQFRGHSDTEVILRLYQHKGVRCFAELNGMFAIMLWDGRTGQLHLVRDRMGIKPLYYTHIGTSLVAASEIKSIFTLPEVRRSFDPVGVSDYLSFQFCLGEETLFEGIRLLAPGTILTYRTSQHGLSATRQRYWQWRTQPNHNRSLLDSAAELRDTIEEVLMRQTRSDVPVGTFLSSGMDTGALAALAVRQLPGLHSFTCGFDTQGIAGDEAFSDERTDSEILARQLGTTHHVLTLGASAMRDYFARTIWHMESPQVGISYQILAMAQEIRPHVTVVLSGTGGDELFAGYHWRYAAITQAAESMPIDQAIYHQWCRLIGDESRQDVLMKTYALSPQERFKSVMTKCDSTDPLDRMLHIERVGFLHGLLQVDDKLNMAASVEARVPLLDNKLLEFAQTIPSTMKYDGQNTKIVLKRALSGLLPDNVIHRRKQGFTPPDAYHLRVSNHLWARERLTGESFRRMGIFREGLAERFLDEHQNGTQNHRFLIWAMLCLQGIQELYMDNMKMDPMHE